MNANRLWIALAALGLLGLTTFAGYFWSRRPIFGEIEGRVTRDGVPLEQVEVIFYPEEDGPRSAALTDKNGHFEAMTDAIQKVPARKGALIGKYCVALVDRRDRIRAFEQLARATEARAKGRDPKQLLAPGLERFLVPSLAQNKIQNASVSGVRVPAQYTRRLDTPFNNIEIKPGKNWFDLDLK